jgi:transporter family protein
MNNRSDGDGDGDGEDVDVEVERSIHILRPQHGRASAIVSSLRFFEQGAFTTTASATASPMMGRLGGSLVLTGRSLQALRDGEGTPLLQRKTAVDASPPPAFTVWIFPALCCAVAYAFYNIFIKKGSASIHPILGGVILQFVAALLGAVLLFGVVAMDKEGGKAEIHYDRSGLLWSVCAGLAVGLAEMLSFYVSSIGVQATQSIPVIIGGSVLFGSVLGMLVLSEKMMLHGWSGVAMLVVGIGLVATDPGDKVEEGVDDGQVVVLSPAFVVWIWPALVCAAAYAIYNIFIKKGSASINPILGGVILQFVAAIFGSLLLGGIVVRGKSDLRYDWEGIAWSVCAGVAVGAAEMISFCVSGMGVIVSQSIPVIIGGSVMFGAVLGILMLGETLLFQGWLGVLLLMIGIVFVATDPGEKVAGH